MLKSWEKFEEILKKHDEILRKVWWNFKKTFGGILEKDWWSFRENLVESEEQLGQKLWEKLGQILRTI